MINWGDGSSERFTTAGIKPHTYDEGQSPRVTVTITGRLDWYGTTQPINQAGLIRVENIGFAMGLTSLARCLPPDHHGAGLYHPEHPRDRHQL